jgi:hypothetical protein
MAPSLLVLRSVVPILTVPVYFLVAWVLFRRNLWRSYLFFWLGILAEGVVLAVALIAPRSYRQIYLVAQPLLIIFYVLMVLEVFRKVFARYPGIARFAQRVVIISMLIAFVFALASAGGDLSNGWTDSTLIQRYSAGVRAVTSALSIYLILIAAFLVWMPVPLPPNTLRHSFLFFFYFMFTTGVHYLLNTSPPGFVKYANLLISVLTLVALLCWLFLLKPEGETLSRGPAAPRINTGILLGRLESINKSLSPPGE